MKTAQMKREDILLLKDFLSQGMGALAYYRSVKPAMSYSGMCANMRRSASLLYKRYGRDLPDGLSLSKVFVGDIVRYKSYTLMLIELCLADNGLEQKSDNTPIVTNKAKATFKLSKDYTDAHGNGFTATIYLEIDYNNSLARLKTRQDCREFIFERRDEFETWAAIADLIKQAVELAQYELPSLKFEDYELNF